MITVTSHVVSVMSTPFFVEAIIQKDGASVRAVDVLIKLVSELFSSSTADPHPMPSGRGDFEAYMCVSCHKATSYKRSVVMGESP